MSMGDHVAPCEVGSGECSPTGGEPQDHHPRHPFWMLALGSIGVVYGDIGTSPLYAFREALVAASGGQTVSQMVVLGVLSMMVWSLVLVVGVKYTLLLLRADNKGQGGTLALLSLAQRGAPHLTPVLTVLGIAGAALFYGDAMITPAISVLSAVEGLKLVTPVFDDFIVPLTVVILVILFAAQSLGTARVATWFGPICLVWFVSIALMGVNHIFDAPVVIKAFNPWYGISFALHHGMIALITLGAVFLTVTGAEALYADLGHFGKRPIQVAWFFLVFPCLLLNYFGQGALVLSDPSALESPFFRLAPSWALIPLVLLATAATVIASQAVITGAYSLSQQASQLGFLPRLEVRHTSEAVSGQIYVPQMNALLLIGVLLLVFLFRTSENLAVAYGIAVTGTMVVTTAMAFCVMHWVWKWKLWVSLAISLPLLTLDIVFLIANLLKVFHGGWITLSVGFVLFVVITTWRRGSRILIEKTRRTEVPLMDLVRQLEKRPPHHVPGTAVFLTSDPDFAPTALLHSLKHYKVLHEKNVILTVLTEGVPSVGDDQRVFFERISENFMRVTVRFGFMQQPNVPSALSLCRKQGWKFDIMSTSFFLSRRSIRPSVDSGMPLWQDKLFIGLARNASDATSYFRIPTSRVVEVGTQVTV